MAIARCVYCNQPLQTAQIAMGGGQVRCPGCRKSGVVIPLPALLEDSTPKPPPPPDPPGEGEAVCFYSPGRRATKECGHCGVLISDVWAAHWGSKVVCLKCLEHQREKANDSAFQSKRTLWDNIALALAVVPFTVVFWFMIFITAPAAIFLSIWHWNSPRSLIPRGKFRLALALLIGLAQVGGGIFLFTGLWFRWFD